MIRRLLALLGALALGVAAYGQDRPRAGVVDFVEGDAMVEPAGGTARLARPGDAIYPADTITTFAAAEVHVAMADGGQLALRENTKITVTVYVANGDDSDSSLIDLAKGTIRSITGWIGKYRRSAYQIRTPMVTIGVRGTDHEPTHLPESDPRGPAGSYDKVNEGSTLMQSEFGSVEVQPGRAAHFTPERRAPPRILDAVPQFFRPTRNEQRFVARAQESVRTLEQQRERRRELLRNAPKPAAQSPRLQAAKAQKAERGEKMRARVEERKAQNAQRTEKKAQVREQRRERFEKKRAEKKKR